MKYIIVVYSRRTGIVAVLAVLILAMTSNSLKAETGIPSIQSGERVETALPNLPDRCAEPAPLSPQSISSHNPIYINSDADFNVANGVTSGTGTKTDPYIIEGWHINTSTDSCITIKMTTAHYIIRNCWLDSEGTTFSGIMLYQTMNGRIEGSVIINGGNGIFIDSCNWMAIVGNNITGNYKFGLNIGISSWCRIYNNIFAGNCWGSPGVKQAQDMSGLNFWNDSIGTTGNFWSDWTSPDNDTDGIVDIPYSLEGGSGAVDFAPLANPPLIPVGAFFVHIHIAFAISAVIITVTSSTASINRRRYRTES